MRWQRRLEPADNRKNADDALVHWRSGDDPHAGGDQRHGEREDKRRDRARAPRQRERDAVHQQDAEPDGERSLPAPDAEEKEHKRQQRHIALPRFDG